MWLLSLVSRHPRQNSNPFIIRVAFYEITQVGQVSQPGLGKRMSYNYRVFTESAMSTGYLLLAAKTLTVTPPPERP